MLTAHGETLAVHENVLRLHSSGIRAANAAAGQAASAAAANSMVLQVHGQILEIHEDAIEFATETALDASAAAESASLAAGAVAAAQEIQVEVNSRLAAGVRAAGVAAAQAAAATSSLALAVEEVDRAAAFAQQTADDAQSAVDSAIAAGNARDQTIKDVSLMTWVAHFQRVRQAMYEVNAPYVDANRQFTDTLVFLDRSQLGMFRVVKVSSGWEIRFKKIGNWGGDVEVTVMSTTSQFGGFTRRWDFEDTSEYSLKMTSSELWQRIFIKVYPGYPDGPTMVNFQNTAAKYRALM